MVAAQIIIILHGIIPKRLTNTQKTRQGFYKTRSVSPSSSKDIEQFFLGK
jgi:elongation factor P hydroxylase